jgi:transposase
MRIYAVAYTSTNNWDVEPVHFTLTKTVIVLQLRRQSLSLFFISKGVLQMKIVYPVCCGVDVHKKFLVATIATTDKKGITQYITETFSTLNRDLYSFRRWLTEHNCFDVCMESTGKYWIPVFNILEDGSIRVMLTHPKFVRAIKGKKTDKKDSKWIADLFKHDLVSASFIPPPEIRALRELARYRYKLVCMRSSEKNRYQDCMTISNIGLANVLTDPFGKTAAGIMKHVLSSQVFNEKDIEKLIRGTAKKKTSLILESIRDNRIESDQRFKMNEVSNHLDYLEQSILKTEVELYTRITPFLPIVKHLANQLPGVTELSAALILAETGVDMSVFESDKHFVSWAGLAPSNDQSAGKKKSVRISKAGQFLKPILVQCALSAVKSKKQPYFAVKYHKLKRRRGHKKAIIAIARMMLTCIYHMVLTGEVFNPSDLNPTCKPAPKKQLFSDETVFAYLVAQGYDVSKLTKFPQSEDSSVIVSSFIDTA